MKTLTNLQVLETVNTFIQSDDFEAFYVENALAFDLEQLRVKIDKMYKSELRKREQRKNAPKVESKESRQRKERASKVLEFLQSTNEPITNELIHRSLNFVTSESDARGIMTTLGNMGKVKSTGEKIKIGDKRKLTVYELI